MTDFLTDTAIFYGLVVLFLGYVLVNARIKLGSFEQAINHYKNTENGSLTGIISAADAYAVKVGEIVGKYQVLRKAVFA